MSARKAKEGRDYLVGYGRPPEHSRFRKGQSGNPTGRRRYTQTGRGQQLARQELFRKVTVRDGNKVVQMPALQAMARSLVLTVIKGKGAALRDFLAILRIVDAIAQGNATSPNGLSSHEDALAELERLEQAATTTIVRTIVDPQDETDLSQLTAPELDEFERLLSKARKPHTKAS